MKPYFFGYLFVRLGKVLATLICVAGLAAAIFAYLQASLEARTAQYLPNTALGSQLRIVKRLQAEAHQTVSGFELASGANASPPPDNGRLETFAHSPPTAASDFLELGVALETARANDAAMKRAVLGGFESAIDNIRNQLLAYAQGVSPPAPASASSATSGSSAPEMAPSTNGIYSARLSTYDVRERLATLDGAKDTLRVLASQSEKAQNKQILTTSVSELESLRTLLPVPLAADRPAADNVRQESAPSPSPGRGPKAAELVAMKLQRLMSDVRNAVASSWASTEAIEQAVEMTDGERQRSQTAGFELRRIWQHAFGVVLVVVLGGAFLAFLLLAMTDLTRALLDAATHSGVVADVYRAAAAPAAPAEQEYSSDEPPQSE